MTPEELKAAVARWEALVEEERAELYAEPEDVFWEDHFDFPDDEQGKQWREEQREEIEREGFWWYATKVKDHDGRWHMAESIGCVVGELKVDDDFYGTQLMMAALELADRFDQEAADELAGRATYAAGAGA